MSDKFDRTQIQGNILRGYRRKVVRHLILEVGDRTAARKFLGATVSGGDADVPGFSARAGSLGELLEQLKEKRARLTARSAKATRQRR